MVFNFDTIIDRRNTDSIKFDLAPKLGLPEDILPLWVADMDFPAPQPVLSVLAKRVEHGIFGYTEAANNDYFDAVAHWYATRFAWKPQPEWLIKMPSVVFALAMAVQALTAEGDAVLIQPPVYRPFYTVVADNGRKVVENPLVYENGQYSIDLDDFEHKIKTENVKMFILCSPHNPVGRVWSDNELRAMGEICFRHRVLIVTDEIHADFTFPGKRHRVLAQLLPHMADQIVTCTAPSKTFNLAALQISNIFASDPSIRQKLQAAMRRCGYGQTNVMGLVAGKAAYQTGGPWLEALNGYLYENLAVLRSFLAENVPNIRLIEPEGTYLAWLDCRDIGLSDDVLEEKLLHGAKIWLNRGRQFGTGGELFRRLNFACPKQRLLEGLARLATVK